MTRESTINDWLHPRAMGLRLYRVKPNGVDATATELVLFRNGRAGVEIVLRRARLGGRVECADGMREMPMWFADVYTDPHSYEQSIALDRGSYNALKNKWMRCKLEFQ